MGKNSGGSTTDPLTGLQSDAEQQDGAGYVDPKQNWGKAEVQKYAPGAGEDAGQEGFGKNNYLARQYAFDSKAYEQTTNANRPDVAGPFGGQQWTQGPNGEWTVNTNFNGALGGAQTSLQQGYADALGKPLSGDSARNQAIDSAYGQATSRLDPQWDKRQAAMQTQLLNQGLDPTSEAGKSAMQDFGMQRNDAYTSALASAIGQGNQAGNDVFRNDLALRQSYVPQMQQMNSLLQTPSFIASGSAPSVGWMQALRDKNNIAIGQQARQDAQAADFANGAASAATMGIAAAAKD